LPNVVANACPFLGQAFVLATMFVVQLDILVWGCSLAGWRAPWSNNYVFSIFISELEIIKEE
jgi:hypothetical protein